MTNYSEVECRTTGVVVTELGSGKLIRKKTYTRDVCMKKGGDEQKYVAQIAEAHDRMDTLMELPYTTQFPEWYFGSAQEEEMEKKLIEKWKVHKTAHSKTVTYAPPAEEVLMDMS